MKQGHSLGIKKDALYLDEVHGHADRFYNVWKGPLLFIKLGAFPKATYGLR
jgi:hypothetical protein